MVITDYIGYYEVPLGESGTNQISNKVVRVAMRKRRWVDGTNATTVDDAQGVLFTSKQSITVEILVRV